MRVTKIQLQEHIKVLQSELDNMAESVFVVVKPKEEHLVRDIIGYIPAERYAIASAFDGEMGRIGTAKFLITKPKVMNLSQYIQSGMYHKKP
jgi:hypothetical protein